MSDLPITKRDVSVASAPVSTSTPPGWQKFTEKPDSTTASVVTKALQDRTFSMQRMAGMLAQRSASERSTMSRLIVAQLRSNAALDFLKATAGVRLAKPKTQQQVPQTEDGGAPGRNESLEALDLAAPGKGAVDLVALAKRVDDADDASSMAYLKRVLADVNAIAGSKTPYSQLRRTALDDVTVAGQAHIVDQVGFRTASSKRADQGGLSTQSDIESSYWRTSFGEALQEFAEKLQADGKLKEGDILVNSPRVLRKLEMVLEREVRDKLTIHPLKGETGISALRGAAGSSLNWKEILEGIGATPSAYQLYELMDPGEARPRPRVRVDAYADLAQLITSSAFSRLQDIARGKGELAPVCAMVEHLLLGLTDKFGPERSDELTADALRSLSRLLDIVVEEPNPSSAMRAVDLMMDEIAVVLAVAKNYKRTDYWKTMQDVLLKRAPSIAPYVNGKEIELSSHLMTSGMDALGTALYIALSSRGTAQVSRATEKVDYFETGMLLGKLKKGETAKPRKDVVVAALNPSTPFEPPSTKNLVEGVLEGLKARKRDDPPFALILDTTVEDGLDPSTGRTRLDEVLNGLKGAIADGSLEVFLCKSFQKYASFGTGKVAAGDLTVLSKMDGYASQRTQAEARLQELDLDLARHDEGQLVIHMLKHGNQDEQALMRAAAGNAEFVDKFCWPVTNTDLGSPYVDGIPLLLRSKPGGEIAALFQNLALVDWRGSFSFLRTSFVDLIPGPWGATDQQGDWYTRINTGHESKQAMVEYFYALGHLTTGMPPGAKKPTGQVDLSRPMKVVKEHWDALDGVNDADDADIARYRDSIMASYCAFACQNVLFKPDVTPMLIAFFARPTTGVSIETRRYLAGELLSRTNLTAVQVLDDRTLTGLCGQAMADFRIPGLDKPDATVTLAALCRAAEVLPDWSMKPFAQALKDKLKPGGDSKEARRLLELIEGALKA
ncbi:hypothetical protein AB0K16_11080 [Nonomuraea jabiensis]|uniref:hypothetical protein n=1 Tax=Nonomuraea jabiensis TaxID=882448 RepID=UPI00342AB0F2